MRPLMHQIIDLDDADFEILLRTARWFTGNPRSGLTIRQVPVLGMGTKWLARNRRLVLACLNITGEPPAGEPDGELEQDDLDPLGLKALPVHVDLILADPADRTLVGGLRHLNAPLPEVDALPVHPETILIVENKESACLVPDRPGPWSSTRLATTSTSWTRSAGWTVLTICTGVTSTVPGSPCCHVPVSGCRASSPSSWTE
jgi:hypothetical protein